MNDSIDVREVLFIIYCLYQLKDLILFLIKYYLYFDGFHWNELTEYCRERPRMVRIDIKYKTCFVCGRAIGANDGGNGRLDGDDKVANKSKIIPMI